MSLGNLIPTTNSQYEPSSRVRVETGTTAFHQGKEFRTFVEIIKPATEVWFLNFTTIVPVLLIGIRLVVDSGACRYSTLSGAVFTGTWTNLPIINRNAALTVQPVSTSTVQYGVSPTVGVTFTGERDIMRVRCSGGSGQSTGTSSAETTAHRGLAIGPHAIRLGPITGVTNTDAVNGLLEIAWSELPDEI